MEPGEVREILDGPADATGITPRQRKILEVIRSSVESRGYPPSVREIGEAVGLTSTSSVAYHLEVLATNDSFSRYNGITPPLIVLRQRERGAARGEPGAETDV